MATSVDQPDDVTITTCCAFPTLASCCTSKGAGGAGVAVFDGACVGDGAGGVGVGFANDGVGAGAGGELATFGVATFAVRGAALAGLATPAGEVTAVDTGWLLEGGGWVPAAEGWLLVQAASANASAAIEAAQAAALVRSRLPTWPG